MVLLDVDHSHMAVPAVYTEYGKLHRKWRGASARSKNRSVRVPRAYSRTQAKLKAHVPHYEKYGQSYWDSRLFHYNSLNEIIHVHDYNLKSQCPQCPRKRTAPLHAESWFER